MLCDSAFASPAGYTAQSLLAALGAVQFISNLVFAACVLRQAVPMHALAATLLIVAGNTVLAVFGDHDDVPKYSAADLVALYRHPYMVGCRPSAAVCCQQHWCLQHCPRKPVPTVRSPLLCHARCGVW